MLLTSEAALIPAADSLTDVVEPVNPISPIKTGEADEYFKV
jgi:hypothetical protein